MFALQRRNDSRQSSLTIDHVHSIVLFTCFHCTMSQDDPVVALTRDERSSIKTTHRSISTYLSPITATTATTHCKTGSIGGKPLRVGEAPEPSAPGTPIGCWNRSPQSKSIHIISSFWWTTTSIIDHPPVFQAQLKGPQGRLVDRGDAWWSLTNLNTVMHAALQLHHDEHPGTL
ncbi:MAG: hypothetical protein J3Q66DRAFT_360918 [Benniella sp.]|nr:MAG: hypothetical protein J3Q66DRAFT_360918 [Benniella sp.]